MLLWYVLVIFADKLVRRRLDNKCTLRRFLSMLKGVWMQDKSDLLHLKPTTSSSKSFEFCRGWDAVLWNPGAYTQNEPEILNVKLFFAFLCNFIIWRGLYCKKPSPVGYKSQTAS